MVQASASSGHGEIILAIGRARRRSAPLSARGRKAAVLMGDYLSG